MKRYVQSIYSKDATVWEVCEKTEGSQDATSNWCVPVQGYGIVHYLPKSEYREVPAPKVWEDVTKECVFVLNDEQILHRTDDRTTVVVLGHKATNLYVGYRLRKITLGTCAAFIVERKKPA